MHNFGIVTELGQPVGDQEAGRSSGKEVKWPQAASLFRVPVRRMHGGRTRLELRLSVAKEAPATGRHRSSHIGSPSSCWESLEDNVSGSPGGAGRGMNIKLWHFRSSSQRETCIFKWTKGKSACRSQSWLVTRALRISGSVSPDILVHKKGGKRELIYKWLVANLLPTLVISSRFKNWKMGCCLDPNLKRAICTFTGGVIQGPFSTRCGACI